MILCKDCAHFRPTIIGIDPPRCTIAEPVLSPVTGKPLFKVSCDFERRPSFDVRRCGPNGQHFVARES